MPTSCEIVFKLPKSIEVWTNMVVSSFRILINPNGFCHWSYLVAVAILFGKLTICITTEHL